MIINQARTKAKISFYNDDEECYFDFLFDKFNNSIVLEEDYSLDFKEAQKRYILLDSDYYHYTINIK